MLKDHAEGSEHWSGDALDYMHPSDLASKDWCPRAAYFALKNRQPYGGEEKFSFNRENIFDEGDDIHTKWQLRMQATGKLWGDWKCLSCDREESCLRADQLNTGWYDVNGAHEHIWKYEEVKLRAGLVTGHEDGAMDDFMVEIKSIGTGTLRAESPKLLARYSFQHDGRTFYDFDRLWRELRRPMPGHVRQAQVYLWMALQMGLSYRKVVFLYEHKGHQQVKEFTVTMSDRLLAPILDGIDVVRKAVESGAAPECPQGGCKYCAQSGASKAGDRDRRGEQPRRRTTRKSRAEGAERLLVTPAPRRTTRHTQRADPAGRGGADGPVPKGE